MQSLADEDIDVIEHLWPKKGWVAVSISPQGTYFLSEEGPYEITTDKEKAEVFDNYENALACLEAFQESIYVESDRENDILHFFKIEKYKNI